MSSTLGGRAARTARSLSESLLGVSIDRIPSLLPGLAATTLLAWLSIRLSRFIGVSLLGFERSPVSPVMLSIFAGLIIAAAIPIPAGLKPGLSFTVKKVLRLGIILLGIRMSVFDVFRLGVYGVPIVVICVVSGLYLTTRISKWLSLPERLGALIAVGTSICGVSAIVATGPAIDAEDKEIAYAVAVITTFGLVATLTYPYLAHRLFSGRALEAGLFLGTAIHDTSQVVGAAKVYADVYSAPLTLDMATITKLVRNVFMVAVIPVMTLLEARRTRKQTAGKGTSLFGLLPLFVVGFLAMSAIRSIGDAGIEVGGNAYGLWDGDTWRQICTSIQTWAGYLLIVALAGVGLSTDIKSLRGLGIKPFYVGLGAALAVGAISFSAISLMVRFVAR